ncbi:uncharacterized protein Dwil_GK19292 [Drosophila willistoni]|uniref:VM domain-containing protein n=1 Tax=Drosophila willistoni TaxID=7260 RepID=B4MN66_DROWI|nr:uncharacterized protein Dwil_GK19292 [Drosophila willistoni]
MYKFLVIAALIACSWAKPGVLAPLPLAYANAPLYASGGSSQVDVRNNYDGTLSSYTTAPFQFTAPFSSRYVSGIPAAPAVVAKYAAAPVAAPLAASLAAAPLVSSYAAPYTSPYLSASFAAPLASPYAAPYATSYAAAPTPAVF